MQGPRGLLLLRSDVNNALKHVFKQQHGPSRCCGTGPSTSGSMAHPSIVTEVAVHTRRVLRRLSTRVLSSALPGTASPSSVLDSAPQPASSSNGAEKGAGEPTSTSSPITPTRITTNGRIIAIGDLHGDWRKAVESLRTANVIYIRDDMEIEWTGGDTVVVQLGDVMDRGDHEIAIVMLLRHLHEQAQRQGGAVYMLNGNHESLNICGDFRYVTPGAFVESALYAGLSEKDLKDWDLLARVRYAVYRPGGPMAVELSRNPTVLIVNETIFAHGGLLPLHVNYGVERLNQEVSAWMRAERGVDGGKALPPFLAMGDANSIMWNRTLSKERFPSTHERYHACRALQQVLNKLGGTRLIVGHTPQVSGANCECDGMVWRMDVGMSYGVLNRPVQVLEISRDAEGQDVLTLLSDPSITMTIDEDGVQM